MATKKPAEPEETVEVVALERGYDNIKVREEGEVFLMPKSAVGRKGNWFEPTKPV